MSFRSFAFCVRGNNGAELEVMKLLGDSVRDSVGRCAKQGREGGSIGVMKIWEFSLCSSPCSRSLCMRWCALDSSSKVGKSQGAERKTLSDVVEMFQIGTKPLSQVVEAHCRD